MASPLSKIFLVPLLCTLSALALSSGCGGKEGGSAGKDNAARAHAAASTDVISIAAAPAVRTSIPRRIEFVGTLAGVEEVTLSTEVEGTVEKIHADLGDPVRRKQTVVSIVQDEFLFRRDQARAEAAQVAAKLGIAPEADGADVEKTSLVRRAQAEFDNAKRDFERRKDLSAKNLIARKDVDDAEARYLVAEAGIRAAREEANNLLATLRARRAQAGLAEKKLKDTLVRSPIDGFIEARLVSAGEYVKVGTPLFRIVDDRPIRLLGEVPELYAASLKSGLAVDLTVDSRPGKTFRGSIHRISPASTAANRAIQVEVTFPNGNRELKSGSFGKASILLRVDPNGVSIPKPAVVTFAGIEKVFVVDNGVVKERRVKLGDDLGDRIEIAEGISAGEQVAVSRTGKLVQGSRVRVDPGGTNR